MSTEQNAQQTQETQRAQPKAVEANVTAICEEKRAVIVAGAPVASPNPDARQPYNDATERPFEGAARLRLAAGHDDPRWMTPAQIRAIGGTVHENAEPVRVYFYERRKDGQSVSLKTYSLVNASRGDACRPTSWCARIVPPSGCAKRPGRTDAQPQ